MVLASVGRDTVTLTLADIPDTWDNCDRIEERRDFLRRTPPRVRLLGNPLDGHEDDGLVLIGEVKDSISGSFKWKRKVTEPGEGQLILRIDHYIARYLMRLPDNAEAKKNTVLVVDHMGGRKRWSGLLKSWNIKTSNGIKMLVVTFIDDIQFLQYMLGAPNPILPIPVFQFPRVLPIFGPAKWAVSMMILLNLIRIEGNLWTLPDDPFDLGSWASSWDWSTWQVLIKAKAFDFDDSSTWSLCATRMQRMDQVIADAMEDGQLFMSYRRIMTIDGETPDVDGVETCRNGTLVLEVVDRSGYYSEDGTSTGGGILGGFTRTLVGFASGFVENIENTFSDDESIQPAQYFQPNWTGTVPSHPWVNVIDSPWSQIESSDLTWSPATATSVIVGGDNPMADALAELVIESVGSLLGYFLLGGFSGLGSIASSVIMPFLVGTIAAWLQWENHQRAQNLGWVHLWETFGSGAESNAWALSAIAALRAAFLATASKTSHVFTMNGSGRYLPGLDFEEGHRIGSTDTAMGNGLVFVDVVEEIELAWDWSSNQPHDYKVKVGDSNAALTLQERNARLLAKVWTTTTNIGIHLVS